MASYTKAAQVSAALSSSSVPGRPPRRDPGGRHGAEGGREGAGGRGEEGAVGGQGRAGPGRRRAASCRGGAPLLSRVCPEGNGGGR